LSWGPRHGFSIARWIQDTTNDVLRLEEGSLYPSLHRMEDKGWVRGEWGTSENNRRAKFYALTANGRRQLVHDTRDWWRYAEAVGKVLVSTRKPAAV
jgi:transcriptional regulator